MGWCILTWAIGIFTGFWFGRGWKLKKDTDEIVALRKRLEAAMFDKLKQKAGDLQDSHHALQDSHERLLKAAESLVHALAQGNPANQLPEYRALNALLGEIRTT